MVTVAFALKSSQKPVYLPLISTFPALLTISGTGINPESPGSLNDFDISEICPERPYIQVGIGCIYIRQTNGKDIALKICVFAITHLEVLCPELADCPVYLSLDGHPVFHRHHFRSKIADILQVKDRRQDICTDRYLIEEIVKRIVPVIIEGKVEGKV